MAGLKLGSCDIPIAGRNGYKLAVKVPVDPNDVLDAVAIPQGAVRLTTAAFAGGSGVVYILSDGAPVPASGAKFLRSVYDVSFGVVHVYTAPANEHTLRDVERSPG